jgi:hypothetical protein
MSSVRATEQLRSVLTTLARLEGAAALGLAEGLVGWILTATGIQDGPFTRPPSRRHLESCAPLPQWRG